MRGFTRLNRVDLYQYEAQQAKKLSSTLTTGELPRDIPIDDWETWAEYVKPVIFPQDPRKVRWDVGMLVFILYSAIVVPWRLGMDVPATGFMWGFEVLISLYFLCDFFVNFFVALPSADQDLYIINREEITRTYLFGWCSIDAASSVPTELIELVLSKDSDLDSLRLLRAMRLLRLLRLLRFLKMRQVVEMIEDTINVELQILSLFKMLTFLFYITHCLGCTWFALHAQAAEGSETTWLTEYRDGELLDASIWSQYLLCIYWALMTLTTVGYGDIVPTNDLERVVVFLSLLVGAIVFGSLLSALGELVATYNLHAARIDEKLRELKEYCRWHRVPLELTVRVRKYAAFWYSRNPAIDEDAVLRPLAPALRREMKGVLARTVLRIPLFSATGAGISASEDLHDFQVSAHRRLKPLIREQHEEILTKGRHHPDVYFLMKGSITATGNMSLMFFELSAYGACFGEEALLFTPAVRHRKATAPARRTRNGHGEGPCVLLSPLAALRFRLPFLAPPAPPVRVLAPLPVCSCGVLSCGGRARSPSRMCSRPSRSSSASAGRTCTTWQPRWVRSPAASSQRTSSRCTSST
jgi:hypothetical protein